ncbi:hypothetical protein GDO78_000067 [Eleutherodactylus coqui]|uniref:Uncharacterized protein n=1 Tax=Eleutherodactylus coqui TaxID=57060 RepID=A0A8J6FNZ9_ELECQ|nr:hypothetical protein GDO78_000067 [Eleutherodactylus coqui]
MLLPTLKNLLVLKNISSRIVCRPSEENNIFSRQAYEKPLASKKKQVAQLEFAKNHINWTKRSNSLLRDENIKFNLFKVDSRNNV